MDPDSQAEGAQKPILAASVSRERHTGPPRRKPRRAGRWLLLLLLLVLVGSLLLNAVLFGAAGFSAIGGLGRSRGVQERFHSHSRFSRDKVAILSVEGTILSGEGFVKGQIERARSDDRVKAVVVRVNSPGGTVSGSDYIYHHLCKLTEEKQIPVVVSMGGMAASGGYYVSMAVGDTPDSIFAEPSTWTGSIGVMIPHYDLSGLLQKWGIEQDSITSDKFKGMGSFTKPMTDEEREILQGLVDESFRQFQEVIRQGRPRFRRDAEALEEVASGRIFTAGQAKERGLVDQIGFLESAVDRAIQLAGLDEDHVKVVKYCRTPSLAETLIGARGSRPSFDLADVLEMSVPRAYYLCTRLPPLTSRP